jgi:DNA polymerase-3 subunit delta'
MSNLHPDEQPSAGAEWPVYGHRWVVSHLARALETAPSAMAPSAGGGPSHATLFTGPRHVGKSTLVRAYARALFCTGPGPRPCGQCRSCGLLERGSHPDLRVVAPWQRIPRSGEMPTVDRDAGKFYMEQVQQVVHDAQLRPVEARYKLIHLQDLHRVADERSYNALLKTIEEPPSHVIVCLTVTDRSSVLPTIVSRCQIFDLQPLDQATVQRALVERWQVEPVKAELLARLAGGRLGWAVEQVERKGAWEEREERLAQMFDLMESNLYARMAFAESVATRSAALFAMVELWSSWWRDVLLMQSGCPEGCAHIDRLETIERYAALLPAEKVQGYLGTLRRTEECLRHTIPPRLPLEVMLLRLPGLPRSAPQRGAAS